VIISAYTTTIDILVNLRDEIIKDELVASESGCLIDRMILQVKKEKYHGKKPRKKYRA